jgi:hypothetical protein
LQISQKVCARLQGTTASFGVYLILSSIHHPVKNLLQAAAFSLVVLSAAPAGAQVVARATELQVGQVYRFEMIDGSNRSGVLDSVDGEFVYLTNLVLGPDKFYRKAVSRARLQAIEKNGSFAAPLPSGYVFGPSANPQRKKELYWNNAWLEANRFQYGFTDHFSAGVGFGVYSALTGYAVLVPSLKYGVSLDDHHHVAVGAIGLIATEQPFRYNYGGALPFAVYTYGDEESQLSAGLGWLYDDEFLGWESGWSRFPTLYAAGSHRVSRGWLLGGEFCALTYNGEYYDSWTGTYYTAAKSSVLALFYGRNIRPSSSWDFALCAVIDLDGYVIPFPLLGYSHRF